MQQDITETDRGLCLQVLVHSPLGFHARPAARLAQEIEHFAADIKVHCEHNSADARSVLDMLTLGAVNGSELFFYAKGKDAHRCLTHIAELFFNEFKG